MGKNHNYTNYSKPSSEEITPIEEVVTAVEEETVEPPVEPIDGVVVNCARLRVRKNPSVDADVLCEINEGSEVLVNEEESTEDFYKVCTSAGVEGYCMKKFIKIK